MIWGMIRDTVGPVDESNIKILMSEPKLFINSENMIGLAQQRLKTLCSHEII